MIPVLGYWELGDICMYWVVSLSGDISGCLQLLELLEILEISWNLLDLLEIFV